MLNYNPSHLVENVTLLEQFHAIQEYLKAHPLYQVYGSKSNFIEGTLSYPISILTIPTGRKLGVGDVVGFGNAYYGIVSDVRETTFTIEAGINTKGNDGANGLDALVYNSIWHETNSVQQGQTFALRKADFNRTPVVGDYIVLFISTSQYALCKITDVTSAISFAYANVEEVVDTKGATGGTGATGASGKNGLDALYCKQIIDVATESAMTQQIVVKSNKFNRSPTIDDTLIMYCRIVDQNKIVMGNFEVFNESSDTVWDVQLYLVNDEFYTVSTTGSVGGGIDAITSLNMQYGDEVTTFDTSDGITVSSNGAIEYTEGEETKTQTFTTEMNIPIIPGDGVTMDVDSENKKVVVQGLKKFTNSTYDTEINTLYKYLLQIINNSVSAKITIYATVKERTSCPGSCYFSKAHRSEGDIIYMSGVIPVPTESLLVYWTIGFRAGGLTYVNAMAHTYDSSGNVEITKLTFSYGLSGDFAITGYSADYYATEEIT